jgi:hypothetical protein
LTLGIGAGAVKRPSESRAGTRDVSSGS